MTTSGIIWIVSISIVCAGAILWGIIVHYRLYKYCHYKCVKCSKFFKPATFRESFLAINGGEQRWLKCPHCNKKEWADIKKGDMPT